MFLNQRISKSESKVKFKMELENEAIGATRTVSAFRQTTLSVICEENYFEHSII